MGTHYKYLNEAFLMNTHTIHFHGEIRKTSSLDISYVELKVFTDQCGAS